MKWYSFQRKPQNGRASCSKTQPTLTHSSKRQEDISPIDHGSPVLKKQSKYANKNLIFLICPL